MKVLSYSNGTTFISVLLIVLVLASLGGASYATYLWQQDQVTELQSEVDGLKALLNEAENKDPVSEDDGKGVTAYVSAKGVKVNVFSPPQGNKVASPVAVVGEVPGNWSFEASFPVEIRDSNGKVVAKAAAQVLGDWMTDKLVPFTVALVYDREVSGEGSLVLLKDNPSDIDENDDSVTIPIKF